MLIVVMGNETIINLSTSIGLKVELHIRQDVVIVDFIPTRHK